MAKNPASFQVEVGSEHVKESKLMLEREAKGLFGEEPEVAEEASEHEVSSEEFEFVERPPKGVIDEFLETLDSSKFAKAPERGTEHDLLADFGQEKLVADLEAKSQEESLSQRSYLFSSQSASVASPQKVKADLEKPEALFEDVKHKVPETSGLLPTPSPPPNTGEPKKTTPLHETEEDKTTTGTEKPQIPKLDRLPSLSTEAGVNVENAGEWRCRVQGAAILNLCREAGRGAVEREKAPRRLIAT
ncbi:hypothetical protein AGOR_G00213540 [Albula goreensis]|uniref:Uncharacterized protein n=1 Tax=Albula goreensis TaxID=1534307 RepID=A0A8T3CS46_9TELE|nr:hypothetical protein AGOR_G00213540 [Albula goreensis]